MNPLLHRLGRWILLLSMASCAVAVRAETQFSIGISVPGVSIGISTPQYPQFVRVPSYPVYYAPQQDANLFFYDGLYWAYQRDSWYSSSWYDGPWYEVGPQRVPLYVLRIPVRYYRDPPRYFGGWQRDAPPRWGDHWGNDWERQRPGWNRWNRSAAPAPAPLPVYQRQYSGERYPRVEQQQQALQSSNYRYQPRDAVVRQRYQQQAVPAARGPSRGEPQAGRPPMQDARQQKQPQQQARGSERREPRPDQARSQGPEQRQDLGQGQAKQDGKGKDGGKDKGQDKDREDNDAPGQQRKK